jgi:transposase-like protein
MQKRKFTAEYKAKIVIEILQGAQTINEIGAREGINPKQLSNWKQEFIQNAARVFDQTRIEKDTQRELQESEDREESLMAKVGSLAVENDFLKKKYKAIHGYDYDPKRHYKG